MSLKEDRTEALYEYLIAYKGENDGNSPSIRDMAGVLNASKSSIHYHLTTLENLGRITRIHGRPNHVVVKGGSWVAPDST